MFRPEIPLFWRLQCSGWFAFSLFTLPIKIQVMGSLLGGILLSIVRDGSSLLLTLGLRRIYWRHSKGPRGYLRILLLIAVSAILASLFQTGFLFALHAVYPFDRDFLYAMPWEADVFYERTGLFFGWSVLYFAIKQMMQMSERRESELQMLRAMINSHFMLNSLNTILNALEQKRRGVVSMVQSLADYLNYSLRHKNDDYVLLGEEVDALEDYLVLEKVRLGEKLDFSSAVGAELRAIRVPGVVLQPLVENAIKYGIETTLGAVVIRLVISRIDSDLLIEIANTGRWKEPQAERRFGGIGLENIKRRLGWLYPERHSTEIIEEQGWVSVRIRLPING